MLNHDDSSYGSRALAKGLGLLDHLARSAQPLPLSELTKLAGLGRASTLRLLRTLQAMGYLVRDEDENYCLDGVWPSVVTQRRLRELKAAALPFLSKLNTDLGETATLAFLFDDHIRVVESLESPQHIKMSNYKGRILQPYASSLGKAIVAYQPPERIQVLLDVYGIYPFTPNTIVDPAAIRQEFAKVRDAGFSQDREETVQGGFCVGAPVSFPGGNVLAAISVSQPTSRLSQERRQALPQMIKTVAKKIEAALSKRLREKPDRD